MKKKMPMGRNVEQSCSIWKTHGCRIFFSLSLFHFIISLQPSNGSSGGEGAPPAQWSNIRQQSDGTSGGWRQRPSSSSFSQRKDC